MGEFFPRFRSNGCYRNGNGYCHRLLRTQCRGPRRYALEVYNALRPPTLWRHTGRVLANEQCRLPAASVGSGPLVRWQSISRARAAAKIPAAKSHPSRSQFNTPTSLKMDLCSSLGQPSADSVIVTCRNPKISQDQGRPLFHGNPFQMSQSLRRRTFAQRFGHALGTIRRKTRRQVSALGNVCVLLATRAVC